MRPSGLAAVSGPPAAAFCATPCASCPSLRQLSRISPRSPPPGLPPLQGLSSATVGCSNLGPGLRPVVLPLVQAFVAEATRRVWQFSLQARGTQGACGSYSHRRARCTGLTHGTWAMLLFAA